jgi:hypothetical protein
MIFPSNEFIGGGPFKQELTVHQNNTLPGMFVAISARADCGFRQMSRSTRFTVRFSCTQTRGRIDAMWEDAKRRAAHEVEWPYGWMTDPQYARERSVAGRVRLPGGAAAEHGRSWRRRRKTGSR